MPGEDPHADTASLPPALGPAGRELERGVGHRGRRDRREARMTGDGAVPRAAPPAGCRGVAQHPHRDAPGPPPLERHDRGEQRHDGGADGGGEVGGAGVADDHAGRALEDGGEGRQVGAAAEVDDRQVLAPRAGRHLRGQLRLAGAARHDHRPAAVHELGHDAGGVRGVRGPGRDRRPGVHHHVAGGGRPARRAGRAAAAGRRAGWRRGPAPRARTPRRGPAPAWPRPRAPGRAPCGPRGSAGRAGSRGSPRWRPPPRVRRRASAAGRPAAGSGATR